MTRAAVLVWIGAGLIGLFAPPPGYSAPIDPDGLPELRLPRPAPRPAEPATPAAPGSGPGSGLRLRPDLRLSPMTRDLDPSHPLAASTWLTYYGRPRVPAMGVLGEMDIDNLVPRLMATARRYDAANGSLGVRPAFHLVYSMATKDPGRDGSHLLLLPDDVTRAYVDRARQEGFLIILDVQVGSLTALQALAPALGWLEHPHVHLALDPEFAMRKPGQTRPGVPPGHLTAQEIGAALRSVAAAKLGVRRSEPVVVLVHQFLQSMIVDKERVPEVPGVSLVVSADGYGTPWSKIAKYNHFTAQAPFGAFKLFYRWDDPLLTPREVLGIDLHGATEYMGRTPNIVIYQ